MSKKTTVILFYLASVLFYIVAIIKLFNSDFLSVATYVSFGSAFLCFGVSAQNKNKRSDDKDTSNKK